MSTTAEAIEITFTEAYEELKTITAKLNGADRLAPDELVALLSRGKGLERALRERLEQVEQQVTAIEGGESFTAYRIVAEPSSGDGAEPSAARSDVPIDDADLQPAPSAPAAGRTVDDIPF